MISLFRTALLAGAVASAGAVAAVEPAPSAGIINAINLQYLKDFFDSVSVFSKIVKGDQPNQAYVTFVIDGAPILAMVYDCEGDPIDGKCHGLALGSGKFKRGVSVEQANDYFATHSVLATPVTLPDTPGPMLKYQVSVYGGVGPDFVNNITAIFVGEEAAFNKYAATLAPAEPSGSAPAFAVTEGQAPELSTAPAALLALGRSTAGGRTLAK